MSRNTQVEEFTSADALIGGVIGGAGGAAAGAISSLLSKERKQWKSLVKREKDAIVKGANASTLHMIRVAKSKAKAKYKRSRSRSVLGGAQLGSYVGAAGATAASLTGTFTPSGDLLHHHIYRS